MAHVLNDRIKETTTTTGTGNISLAGAETGFETFVSGVGDGNTTYYAISHQTTNEFEIGLGTVNDASPDTISGRTNSNVISSSNSDNVFDFSASNKAALGVFDLFFVLGASKDATDGMFETGVDGVTVYKLASCSVGSASIDFDIEGIAQIAWSGNGQSIEEAHVLNTGTSAANDSNSDSQAAETTKGLIKEGVGDTDNYIRNKLTDLTISYDASETTGTDKGLLGSSDVTYAVTLTGGNITIENNMTYLTPETLGSVNLPLGHVMGTRSVSGNFTCYLDDKANGSLALFENLQESRGVITNAFSLTFGIGGSGSTVKRVIATMPKCHLELPTHSLDDVISVETNYHSLPSDLSSSTAASATKEVNNP